MSDNIVAKENAAVATTAATANSGYRVALVPGGFGSPGEQ